jgi:DNA-binding transcriptional ArsR family regulator
MLPFSDLGARVDQEWERASFDELALPRIAADALLAARIPEQVSGDDVLGWLLRAPSLPPQTDIVASFGQPPVTVYRGRRFHVQVLYWLNGSTTIHRHGFCGAFQVLEGGSLHSRWRFSPAQRVSSHMALGQTELLSCEILQRGDVVPITPDLTHGLYHLEAPSATIVVRSDGEIEHGPQYEYHPPSVAIDPFFVDPLVERWLQALRLLRASGHTEYRALAADLVARSDPYTVFRVLDQTQREDTDFALLEALTAAARPRLGAVADDLARAVREGVRRRAIHRLRRADRDPDRRFFLALLQNLPDRDAIYRLVGRRVVGKDPRETVLRWIADLSGTSLLGVDTSGDLERILIESMLDGVDQDAVFARLGEVFDAGSIEAERGAVLEHAARIGRTLLAPLFARSAS